MDYTSTNVDDFAPEPTHPIMHLCRKCLSLTRVVAIAMIVEVITFYPTHLLFERLGWM